MLQGGVPARRKIAEDDASKHLPFNLRPVCKEALRTASV